MSKIAIPKSHADLPIRPPVSGSIPLSDTMQHVLALLVGSTQEATALVRLSPHGFLQIVSPRLQDIVHYTATSDNYTKQGDNLALSEVMVVAHPDNMGRVWCRPYKTATVDNAYPLDKKEGIVFAIDNLNQLNLLIEATGEKVIVFCTV